MQFSGPFRRCHQTFQVEHMLKKHLRKIRDEGYNTEHPPGAAQWCTFEDNDYLTVYTWPGNLDVRSAKQRRSEVQKRHYQKNHKAILGQQKQRRQHLKKSVELTTSLSTFAQSASLKLQKATETYEQVKTAVGGQGAILESLYSTVKPRLEDFVDLDADPDMGTFARLVTYLLPFNQIPPILAVGETTPLIFDVIPNSGHFRRASALIHPD